MFRLKYPVEQSEPPRSPRETLPTMYDLPSENPEEPGLPDELHALQPQLLSRTCRPAKIPAQQMFTGTDMNLSIEHWILTDTEQALQQAEQAEALLEQERQEKERLLERLRQLESS